MLDQYKALILAIIEGITELLPISSTAHLVFTARLLEFNSMPNYSFEVIIQFAAIMPLLFIYRKELFAPLADIGNKANQLFYVKFLIAFLPIVIIGGLFGSVIKAKIFNLEVIVVALILGGLIMLFNDRLVPKPVINELSMVGLKKSLLIGLCQLLALVPGVSRAGATIIGGMFIGLNRDVAAKFSFFLAIPTIFAASFYDLVKNYQDFTVTNLQILLIGFVVSFLVSYLVIINFKAIISNIGLKILGGYRIVLGVAICFWYL